jgi:rod shape-determining protein MreD
MLSPYVMRQSLPQRRAGTTFIVLELGPTARVVIALLLMVALQTMLVRLPYLGPFFEYVDFILILTVFVGVQPRALRAALVGMTGGLLQDLVWGVLYGASGFTKMLIGYALAVVSVKFSLDSKATRLLVLPLCSVVNTGLFAFFLYFFSMLPPGTTLRDVVRVGMFALLGNGLAGIALFPLGDRWLGKWIAVRSTDEPLAPRAF